MTDIEALIQKFTRDITDAVRVGVLAETRNKMLVALGGSATTFSPQRMAANPEQPKKSRRKGPIQLCPVPKCANRAAPVFGMVCARHKDVPKAKIKAYRAARRAAKGR